MNATPELLNAMQRDLERTIELDRMASLAACANACCNPSILARAARAIRGSADHLTKAVR